MKIMKINKRRALALVALLLVVFLVSSCSSKSSMRENSFVGNDVSGSYPSAPQVEYEEQADMDMGEAGFNPGDVSVEPAKVITNVHLSLETIEFDSSIDRLNNIINASKGFVENSNISLRNYGVKYAEYTIRVPRDNVDNFTDQINSVGSITSQNTSRQDVTKQYYDMESRLNLLKIKEERMTAILEKADKIEDIITIENQLSEIIHQKESLSKDVLTMDDKIAYSTVYLYISEVEKLRGDISTTSTFGTRFADAFGDSLYTFKVAAEEFVIVFIYLLPFLIVVGVIAFLVIKFIKKRRQGPK